MATAGPLSVPTTQKWQMRIMQWARGTDEQVKIADADLTGAKLTVTKEIKYHDDDGTD